MRIERLEIKNFKSLRNISIKNPNAFTVFAGANASGKSNIFEALELFNVLTSQPTFQALKVFGTFDDLLGRHTTGLKEKISFELETKNMTCDREITNPKEKPTSGSDKRKPKESEDKNETKDFFLDSIVFPTGIRADSFKSKNDSDADAEKDFIQFSQQFSRLFLNNTRISRQKYLDDSRLDFYGSNLEKVLKRLMLNNDFREELTDILSLWIPGLESIVVHKDSISGNDMLHFYESGSKKPFQKNLVSDGTLNIITLLVAIYQTDKPQFLCIEEPENGLNPKVIIELVELIRQRVKETGQHIWLSTHSETLVAALKPEELILVDKIEGYTTIRQFQDINLHGLSLEKAWLSNVLGGGLPW